MNDDKLKKILENELNVPFRGWDFEYITNSKRMEEDSLPWNYKEIVEKYSSKSECILDMGTGGGEFLSSLNNLPNKVFATEGFVPNIEVAKERLKPLGIEVKQIYEDNIIPFENEKFDLIINRHEEYLSSEINRVLKPNGIFLTQQVGGVNDFNLNLALGSDLPEYLDWGLFKTIEDLNENGFSIFEKKEFFGKTRFYDTGAICYYLKCIPWQIEDFSIDKYFSRLKLINEYIQENNYIEFINHRFYLIAKKI